jgi:DNA-binding protein HU-beta
MNKKDLLVTLAQRTETSQVTVLKVLDELTRIIQEQLASEGSISISKLAKFEHVHRAARMGRNPQTGAPLQISERVVVKVKALYPINKI